MCVFKARFAIQGWSMKMEMQEYSAAIADDLFSARKFLTYSRKNQLKVM
jgi:hypothetical protein